jgi:3-O-methylgallate 3,4-dioxygenase
MATLVLGVGTSHSPMLMLDAAGWVKWADGRDQSMTDLADDTGCVRTYDEWAALRAATMATEITPGTMTAKVKRCATAMAELSRRIEAAELDAMIVVGDDQGEHLGSENLPPFLVYYGATLTNTEPTAHPGASPMLQQVLDGYHEAHGDREYPVAQTLAKHLIASLLEDGFDIATSDRLPRPRAEGHALQFVHRYLLSSDLPIVPVLLNTYMPPAQPRASRCHHLGAALAAAVRSWPDDARVGILASGGLSHFLISERLDRRVLDACAAHDGPTLCAIPEAALQSGTSEIKNWISVAGACRGLQFDLIDYVPGYRTPAGTGTGLAFATWSRT